MKAFLAWLLGAVFSGLVWDEVSHQFAKRGWTRSLCRWFIAVGSRTMPEDHRESYIEQAMPEIENLLAERRHLAALRVGFSFVTTLPVAFALSDCVYCLTAVVQVPFYIALYFSENSTVPADFVMRAGVGYFFLFLGYGVLWRVVGIYRTGLMSRFSTNGTRFGLVPLIPVMAMSHVEVFLAHGHSTMAALFALHMLAFGFVLFVLSTPILSRKLFHKA